MDGWKYLDVPLRVQYMIVYVSVDNSVPVIIALFTYLTMFQKLHEMDFLLFYLIYSDI